ncbi:MAG: DUF3617 family protein [Desulfuromonadaceae bacterium]|jgi:hypothetical protein
MKKILFGLLGGLVFAGPVLAGGVDMREGLWEITTTTEMAGMPFQIPPMTFTQCITQQDLVPQEQKSDNECTMSHSQISGNQVSWTFVCKGEGGSSRGEGTITYHGDRFDGKSNIAMEGGMQMVNKMQGKHIGPCQ